MFLLTHSIRLPYQRCKSPIRVSKLSQSEVMHVIARRDGEYPFKVRVLGPPLQPQAALKPMFPRDYTCKPNTHLKNDACFLRVDRCRATFPNQRAKLLEQLPDDRVLPLKVIGNLIPVA